MMLVYFVADQNKNNIVFQFSLILNARFTAEHFTDIFTFWRRKHEKSVIF